MTQFTLNVENEKRLTTLGGQVKDLATMTKPILVPTADGQMSINLYSSKNAMTFNVDISDYSSTDDVEGLLNYFSINLEDLCSTVSKISNDCEDDISITVDKSISKVTFKNLKTNSRISLATFTSVVSQNDATASISAVDTVYNVHFQSGAKTITITPDIISFYETAQRFRAMYPAGRSNAIAVNRNKVRFGSGLVIIEETLDKDASTYDGNIYLKKTLVDFVKPFVKVNGSLDVMLNENDDVAYIDAPVFGFKAIRSIESTTYEYPTDEEIASVVPTEDHSVVVTVDKKAFINTLGLFDGTFKNANWNWKVIRMDSSAKYIGAGCIGFEHHDSTAECETTLPVTVVSNNIQNDDFNFIISSQAVKELLERVTTDTFTIEYNDCKPSEMHGGYIHIYNERLSAYAVKVREKGQA